MKIVTLNWDKYHHAALSYQKDPHIHSLQWDSLPEDFKIHANDWGVQAPLGVASYQDGQLVGVLGKQVSCLYGFSHKDWNEEGLIHYLAQKLGYRLTKKKGK